MRATMPETKAAAPQSSPTRAVHSPRLGGARDRARRRRCRRSRRTPPSRCRSTAPSRSAARNHIIPSVSRAWPETRRIAAVGAPTHRVYCWPCGSERTSGCRSARNERWNGRITARCALIESRLYGTRKQRTDAMPARHKFDEHFTNIYIYTWKSQGTFQAQLGFHALQGFP